MVRYTPELRVTILLFLVLVGAPAVSGQLFVAGLAGVADLSGAAATRTNPPAASNYDPMIGLAWSVAAGYHWNDWLSGQAGYSGNRNRILSTAVAVASVTNPLDGTSIPGFAFQQQDVTQSQASVGADFMVYFRPRSSHLRPYVAVGPAWVRILSESKPGFHVAVGVDAMSRSGWGFRYAFGETMTGNPLAQALRPPASRSLMNFQSLFGIVKRF